MKNIYNNDLIFKCNCGNCIHSSLEIIKNNKIICDKDNSIQNFDEEKKCYE